MLLFLLLVVAIAAVGGLWPGLAARGRLPSCSSTGTSSSRYHTFTIEEAEDVLALFVFLAVGAIVSSFVALASRRAAEGARARAEAEALARLAGSLLRPPPFSKVSAACSHSTERPSPPPGKRLAHRGGERRSRSRESRGQQHVDRARLRARAGA